MVKQVNVRSALKSVIQIANDLKQVEKDQQELAIQLRIQAEEFHKKAHAAEAEALNAQAIREHLEALMALDDF